MKNNILYSTDGKGRWVKREWKPQCSERVFLSGQCQGIEGHKGVHWCYSPCGHFRWEDNNSDPQHDGCSGSTPPDHKEYMSPKKMEKHLYMSHYEDTEVTDEKVIAKLEAGKPPEKGASITRPLSIAESKKLKRFLK
jgi:hypothetical protein